MGVNLGGGQVAVAQQQLHDAQVGAVIEQVGGEGVAQGVGRQRLVDAGDRGPMAQPVPEGLAGHGAAPLAGKEYVALSAAEDLRPALANEFGHAGLGFLSQRHQPLLVPLADNAHHPLTEVELVQAQCHQLRHPQAGGVEQFQHGLVALAQGRFLVRRREQSLHVVFGQAFGQRTAQPGIVDQRGGILVDQIVADQVTVKPPQTGKRPPRGAGAELAPVPIGQVLLQFDTAGGVQRHAPLPQPVTQRLQIAPVGGQGIVAEPALHPDHVQEAVD